MIIHNLPNARGSYLLVLNLAPGQAIEIGQAGWIDFPPGYYVYTGSAMGSGGIKTRLGRHLAPSSKRHWHIDFLRGYTQVIAYAWVIHDFPRECDWIRVLAALPVATFPAKGFGAGDCHRGCAAHLVHFPDKKSIDRALEMIETYEIGRTLNIQIKVLDNPITLC